MLQQFTGWLSGHYIEALGAILGIVYIILSIKQNIYTWPAGILSSALYVIVFFQSKFYAGMGLQVYYVAVSIYGWYYWLQGIKKGSGEKVRVTRIKYKTLIKSTAISAIIYIGILYILLNYTDSPIPYMDSLTTTLSIMATWMLARKIIDNWLLWVFVDIVSIGLYIYRGLWATTILFLVYTIMAVAGYIEWKKDLKSNGD
jgi:nicotinamide mononucleotide transporter